VVHAVSDRASCEPKAQVNGQRPGRSSHCRRHDRSPDIFAARFRLTEGSGRVMVSFTRGEGAAWTST
jgi:hypothetical protein